MRPAIQRFWLGAAVIGLLIAVLVELKAQPAAGEDALVLSADETLGAALRAGDRSAARRLLSLQFSFADENGKIHERKDFLADLKSVAAAPGTDVKVKVYGLVAMVTGYRKSALGNDAFFLDIWAKQKRAWRALTMQDVLLAAPGEPSVVPEAPAAPGKPSECKNPCQTIPYRVRSPAEQDIVNAFEAIERASFAHDADEWSKHIADEYVEYRSGQVPIPKLRGSAVIEDQKQYNIAPVLTAIQSMRLSVYGDGAAMITTNGDYSAPLLQIARVWVKRNGQWLLTISVQTAIKPSPQ
jgi:hypothetical protein